MVTSKNRFEKGKWVECAECDESQRSLRGGLKKQSVCYTHFHSNKVFRGDHYTAQCLFCQARLSIIQEFLQLVANIALTRKSSYDSIVT